MRASLHRARILLIVSMLVASSAAFAGGLEGFLDEVDVRASADLGSFRADLSATFDVSERRIDGMFEIMSKPSDVYMCLRLGEVAHQPVDRVVQEYEAHRGQGWGVIAKNLGIKPGSEEFHALKAGRLPARDNNGGSTVAKGNGRAGKGKK
jgi:hypothetical protein